MWLRPFFQYILGTGTVVTLPREDPSGRKVSRATPSMWTFGPCDSDTDTGGRPGKSGNDV